MIRCKAKYDKEGNIGFNLSLESDGKKDTPLYELIRINAEFIMIMRDKKMTDEQIVSQLTALTTAGFRMADMIMEEDNHE